MNWEAIGAVAQMVAAVAVVMSLVYLSIQIRHNSQQVEAQVKALNAASLNAIENTFTRFRESMIRDKQVASLWRRALASFEDLEPDEKAQADAMFQEYCWAWQNTIIRITKGTYEREGIEPYLKNLVHVMRTPGARQWWSTGKREFAEQFVDMVDTRVAWAGWIGRTSALTPSGAS
jgi:hypothetical protein